MPKKKNLPSVKQCFDADFWRAICPKLHIRDNNSAAPPFQLASNKITGLKQRISHDGYFKLPPSKELDWSANIADVAQGIAQLVERGLPASFVFVFDEPWEILHAVSGLMSGLTGGNRIIGDVLAWYVKHIAFVRLCVRSLVCTCRHVDPNKNKSGFPPHRDRQPADIKASFHKPEAPGETVGMPKYISCWIPLTDATPENSCLYVIPAACDPGYLDGDNTEKGEEGPDLLRTALSSVNSYQNVRCLAEKAGGAVCFSHRIIHWGSTGRKDTPAEIADRAAVNRGTGGGAAAAANTAAPANTASAPGPMPRISLTFACAADDFEQPYFDRKHFPKVLNVYCTMLYDTVRYCAMLYMLCHTVPYCTILYHTVPYCTILCHTLPYTALTIHCLLYHTLLTVPYTAYCNIHCTHYTLHSLYTALTIHCTHYALHSLCTALTMHCTLYCTLTTLTTLTILTTLTTHCSQSRGLRCGCL
jgi:hypothetical protein